MTLSEGAAAALQTSIERASPVTVWVEVHLSSSDAGAGTVSLCLAMKALRLGVQRAGILTILGEQTRIWMCPHAVHTKLSGQSMSVSCKRKRQWYRHSPYPWLPNFSSHRAKVTGSAVRNPSSTCTLDRELGEARVTGSRGAYRFTLEQPGTLLSHWGHGNPVTAKSRVMHY